MLDDLQTPISVPCAYAPTAPMPMPPYQYGLQLLLQPTKRQYQILAMPLYLVKASLIAEIAYLSSFDRSQYIYSLYASPLRGGAINAAFPLAYLTHACPQMTRLPLLICTRWTRHKALRDLTDISGSACQIC